MSTESGGIVRLLYRSLLKISAEVDGELSRGPQYLKSMEMTSIGAIAGLERCALKKNKSSLPELVKLAFRNKFSKVSFAGKEGSMDLDAGFRTLRYMNSRLPVYRKLVYDNCSNTITEGVRVKVSSHFLGRDNFGYKFAYNVRIANEGSEPVTLVNREWKIVDYDGHEDIVRGPGVVGQQPVIKPGTTYEYNSGTPLRTTMGCMWGKYEMVKQQKKEVFEAQISPFALLVPREFG